MKNLSRFFNLALLFMIGVVLFFKIPLFYSHYQMQNLPAPDFNLQLITSEHLSLNDLHERKVIVFWATWCGPCSLELSRINQMIKAGEIKASQVLAIALDEKKDVVEKAVQERDYLFQVGLDAEGVAATAYKISVTPTIIFIDEAQKINWMSTGLSPTLGLRLNWFLN